MSEYPKKLHKNVLIFPGGTEIGLEIARSLRYCKEVDIFSTSSGVKQHGPYFYKNHRNIPDIYNEGCLTELNNLIEEWNIDCILPSNPLVLDFLRNNRYTLGCSVVMPDDKILDITRSKIKTYEYFNDLISVPLTYENYREIKIFPVFIKPDNMYGAQGTRLVKKPSEFLSFPPAQNDIICEYLPGPEYSIDCFSDRHGKLLFVGPRSRERVRMGTSMHCEIPCDEIKKELSNIAVKINNAILMRGAWFFQVKADKTGKFKLLEIETRIAGTMALNRVLGVNFPLLSLYDHFEIDVRVSFIDNPVVIDRSLANRYSHNINYDTVYIDLDDTIIIKNKINLQVIQFIFQCINNKKDIVLLTKSTTENLHEFLNSWKIYKLFDEIILLDENDLKSNYIKDKNSIFIDDSYSQRMEVSRRHGILTFDPSMVEVLIDERC